MLSVRLVKTLTVYLVNLIHSVLFLLNVINARMDMSMILIMINVDLFVKTQSTSIILTLLADLVLVDVALVKKKN
jgi:hypothetical protein